MGDRARDKVSWDDFSVWLSALKPRGIGLSEHFSAKYQDEAHYRWACSPGTQPSWTLEQKAEHIIWNIPRKSHSLTFTSLLLALPIQTDGSIHFNRDLVRLVLPPSLVPLSDSSGGSFLFKSSSPSGSSRCGVCRWLWLGIRLIWLYGIWFDSKESTSQNPKSSKSSSGIPRMYEVTFDGVGCFMITNFTSFDIIRAPNVPTTSFQRSWDCTLMRDRHPIWFITVCPYTTTLIITCSNDLDLTAALKKEVNCSIWWRPSFVIIEVYWLHSAQNVICTAPDLRTSRKL